MRNQAMQREIDLGRCIDVSKCARTTTDDYVLESFRDNMYYCDADREVWIWSIGKVTRPLPAVMADGTRRTLEVGTFLASTDARHYSPGNINADWIECVWLR